MLADHLTEPSVVHPRPIALVLAAGDGVRLQAFTERWFGTPRPKQYCTFVGTRSMLDHTLDRAAEVCRPRATALWAGAQASVDDLIPYFEWFRAVIGTTDELDVLDDIYSTMPTRNFSRDVLEPLAKQTAVMALWDVMWSDWGRPERIMDTLSALRKEGSSNDAILLGSHGVSYRARSPHCHLP